MDSILLAADSHAVSTRSELLSTVHGRSLPCTLTYCGRAIFRTPVDARATRRPSFRSQFSEFRRLDSLALASNGSTHSAPTREGMYTVGDFMTRKEHLYVVKPTTTVDEALDILVEKRITGFPVIDDDWNLVGVVSDYDLLAIDSISGGGQCDTNMFPDVDSSWKTFNEIQKLLRKTNGKVIGDLMTPAPMVVRENTNLEDAVRLLLRTKFRRLPVVNGEGKLVGIITRGNVVRAALQIKKSYENS